MQWIVCGYYTNDSVYRRWAFRLKENLDDLGIPHDIVQIDKITEVGGGHAGESCAGVGRHEPPPLQDDHLDRR